MNTRERVGHFQFFAYVCGRSGWTEFGRALAPYSAAQGYHALRVWHRAQAEAGRANRPATLDDLRHAIYWLACRCHSVSQLRTPQQQARVHGLLLLILNDTDPVGHQLCPPTRPAR